MYNVRIFSFHHKPYENNLDRNIHIPFFIGNPENNTQNFLMDVNYENNINYLNPIINEFTGIYCILNNFNKICVDLKIDQDKLDFFGFEHYHRILNLDLNKLDKNCAYCFRAYDFKIFRKMIAVVFPIIRKFYTTIRKTNDIRLDNHSFISTEQIICTPKIIPELRSYVNIWRNIVEELMNDIRFTKLFKYKMIRISRFYHKVYPDSRICNYLSYHIPVRLYGFLTEYIMGIIYETVLENNHINIVTNSFKHV